MQKISSLPADDAECGWYHLSPTRFPKPAHAGSKSAPWVIVGAGYTGLAVARQLALNFPDQEVVLVEAQEVGFGTAGRNAGFVIDLPHDIAAHANLKLNLFGQQVLRRIVEENQI